MYREPYFDRLLDTFFDIKAVALLSNNTRSDGLKPKSNETFQLLIRIKYAF